MKKFITGILCVLVVLGAFLLWSQHDQQTRLQKENSALREQLQQLANENLQASNQLASHGVNGPVSADDRELMKLRSEVSGLRRALAEAKAQASRPENPPPSEPPPTEPEDPARQLAIAKLNYTKGWLLAFMTYAQQHDGKLPPDFASAAAFAPEAVTAQTNLISDQFEMLYNGSLNDLTNLSSLILFREKQPVQASDGSWSRGYGFADGHSEIHRVVDGNFDAWEAQHMVPPTPAQPGQ